MVARIDDPTPGTSVLVPDTNALLYNPSLDAWAFPYAPQCTLALVPAVLSELDLLNVNHRTEAVRKKPALNPDHQRPSGASSILDGVPLVSGGYTVIAIATEPDFAATLPWLDPSNADDRLLAAALEVMRARPRSVIAIVTRDINLQTKAEYARVPHLEPPEVDDASDSV